VHSKRTLIVAGSLTALVVWLALSEAAFAHARPVRFDPAAGAVLSAAPARVTGWFSSDIRRADGSFVQVLDSQKRRVDQGATELANDRRSMSVALPPGLPEGRYLVYYSTVDDGDGHTYGGCYAFFIGQAAAESAQRGGDPLDGGSVCPATAAEAQATPTPAPGDEPAGEEGGGDGVPVWALIAGVAVGLVVGGLCGRLLGNRA
jgi:methionine-rich copper-binding protein CopC